MTDENSAHKREQRQWMEASMAFEFNTVDPETTDQEAECAECPNVTQEPFDCRQCGRLFCPACAPKRLTWCQECQSDICDKHEHEHDAWGA